MSSSLWLLAQPDRWQRLEQELHHRVIKVTRVSEGLAELSASLYDADGLLVIDREHSEAAQAINMGTTLVPVLVLASPDATLAEGILSLDASMDPEKMSHHLIETMNAGGDVRRYPRVPLTLMARVETPAQSYDATLVDASLYGGRLELTVDEAHWPRTGVDVEVSVYLEDSAEVRLSGRVVANREGGLAVRLRPTNDSDLVLWLHLLLGELSNSPLYADADPFGPLFR